MPLAYGALSERPAQGSVAGDPYIATDTHQNFIWSGTEWVSAENFTQAEHDALPNPHHSNANDLTAEQKTDLTDGGQTTLHSHAGGGFQFPVGAVYLEASGVNPGTTFGYGTWAQRAQGRVLIGFDATDPDYDAVGDVAGAKTHTHDAHPALPHTGGAVDTHSGATVSDHATKDTGVAGVGATQRGTTASTLTLKAHIHSISAYVHTVGQAINHVFTQPSDHAAQSHAAASHMPAGWVVYVWERTV